MLGKYIVEKSELHLSERETLVLSHGGHTHFTCNVCTFDFTLYSGTFESVCMCVHHCISKVIHTCVYALSLSLNLPSSPGSPHWQRWH